jgi:formylglycine-generating enzyme required for sulfatase activity
MAARGTDGRKYPWGNEWDGSRCCNSVGSYDRSTIQPRPVGSYPSGASPYGCLDMAGNVWEWCSSKHEPYPYKAGDGRESAGGSDERVRRGGSWAYSPDKWFRGAERAYNVPSFCDYNTGFRPARTR